MMPHYTDIDIQHERNLYQLIADIERSPGLYIGEASITYLSHFLGGYAYAIAKESNYLLHFNRDFQAFVSEHIPSKAALHWHRLIAKGKNERDAFYSFYDYFRLFLKSQNI